MKTISLKFTNLIIIQTFIIFMILTPKLAIATNETSESQPEYIIVKISDKDGSLGTKLDASKFKDMPTTTVNSEMKPLILSFLEFAQQLGAVALAFGMFTLFLSFKDDNAAERVKGMLSLFGGFLMVSLKTIMTQTGMI